ncbi:MAG: imidazole glycerol phosphate synthase subunit HisH [Bacteroidota bacterium]
MKNEKIAIIRYNAGNIESVKNALDRLGVESFVTGNADAIQQADKVIFPGVGNAASAMTYLRVQGLDKLLCELKQPVLGICLGMQLFSSFSEEGNTKCLGVLPAKVKKFTGSEKIPHMGWNRISNLSSPLFKGIEEGSYAYFVHSYYMPLTQETTATSDYIQPFTAALNTENFYATQFHPEKSGEVGELILKNFTEL